MTGFTPEKHRIRDQCSFARCRQPSTLLFHLKEELLEACKQHEKSALNLMQAQPHRNTQHGETHVTR